MARFWVGGTGNWSDTTHWSASSGGAGGSSVPSSTDDVTFDGSSFSADSQVVTLDSGTPTTKALTFANINHTVTVSGSLTLTANGSVTLSPLLTLSFAGLFLIKPTLGATITLSQTGANLDGLTSGIKIANPSNSGTGNFTANLGSDIYMPNSQLTFSTGFASSFLGSNNGTFNSNDYTITVSSFSVSGSTNGTDATGNTTVNLGASVVYASSINWGGTTFFGYSVTINGSSSTVILSPASTSSVADITHSGVSGAVTFGTLIVNQGIGYETFSNDTFTVTNQFILKPGSFVKLGSATIDVTGGSISASGIPTALITVQATSATMSTDIASLAYVAFDHVTATGSGAPFDDTVGGIDNGGNTDITFPSIPRKYNAGTEGKLIIAPNRGEVNNVTIDVTGITADRTYTGQDASGTLAFTTDLTPPGSPDTSVQFNNGGVFAGDSTFVFDSTGKVLTVKSISGNVGSDLSLASPDTNTGNSILILPGSAISGNNAGGDIGGNAGGGSGSSPGGSVFLNGGNGGDTGAGGDIQLQAGAGGATSGASGNITLFGGNAQGGTSDGGDILLFPGIKSGAGVDGHVKIIDANTSFEAIVDTSLLAANRTYQTPDASGVLDLAYSKVTTSWLTTGNTHTVTDAHVTTASFVAIMNIGIPAGRWKIVLSNGSFVITSSDSESAGLAFAYKVFNL